LRANPGLEEEAPLGQRPQQGEIEVVSLLLRDRALVGTGLDLIEQHIARPAKAGGGSEIPEAGGRVGELVEDEAVMSPWNFCNKLLQKLARFDATSYFGHSLWPNFGFF
jgi:hypothetical protein